MKNDGTNLQQSLKQNTNSKSNSNNQEQIQQSLANYIDKSKKLQHMASTTNQNLQNLLPDNFPHLKDVENFNIDQYTKTINNFKIQIQELQKESELAEIALEERYKRIKVLEKPTQTKLSEIVQDISNNLLNIDIQQSREKIYAKLGGEFDYEKFVSSVEDQINSHLQNLNEIRENLLEFKINIPAKLEIADEWRFEMGKKMHSVLDEIKQKLNINFKADQNKSRNKIQIREKQKRQTKLQIQKKNQIGNQDALSKVQDQYNKQKKISHSTIKHQELAQIETKPMQATKDINFLKFYDSTKQKQVYEPFKPEINTTNSFKSILCQQQNKENQSKIINQKSEDKINQQLERIIIESINKELPSQSYLINQPSQQKIMHQDIKPQEQNQIKNQKQQDVDKQQYIEKNQKQEKDLQQTNTFKEDQNQIQNQEIEDFRRQKDPSFLLQSLGIKRNLEQEQNFPVDLVEKNQETQDLTKTLASIRLKEVLHEIMKEKESTDVQIKIDQKIDKELMQSKQIQQNEIQQQQQQQTLYDNFMKLANGIISKVNESLYQNIQYQKPLLSAQKSFLQQTGQNFFQKMENQPVQESLQQDLYSIPLKQMSQNLKVSSSQKSPFMATNQIFQNNPHMSGQNFYNSNVHSYMQGQNFWSNSQQQIVNNCPIPYQTQQQQFMGYNYNFPLQQQNLMPMPIIPTADILKELMGDDKAEEDNEKRTDFNEELLNKTENDQIILENSKEYNSSLMDISKSLGEVCLPQIKKIFQSNSSQNKQQNNEDIQNKSNYIEEIIISDQNRNDKSVGEVSIEQIKRNFLK